MASNGKANQGQKEEKTMPTVELIKMTRGLRGKGNAGKKVEYMGIAEGPRPENPVNVALELVKQDLQEFWDRFILGYNEFSFDAIADPIGAFIDPSWDAEKIKNFRGSVNFLSKTFGKDREEIAEGLIAQMKAQAEESSEKAPA
jgi:hypothetical protein